MQETKNNNQSKDREARLQFLSYLMRNCYWKDFYTKSVRNHQFRSKYKIELY